MKETAAFLGGFLLGALGRIKIGHVMVIALFVGFVWICGIEAQPSALKAGAMPKGNERAEVLNCGLQGSAAIAEKDIYVIRPRGRIGIDGTKLC